MNPILSQLGQPLPQQSPGNLPGQNLQNNPMQLRQQFFQFRQALRGRDPQAMINSLIASGRISPQQFETLKAQAQQLQNMLR